MNWMRVVVLVVVWAVASTAPAITLVDMNSTVQIDPLSQAGVHSWQIDGTENLFQQWFWYRVGDGEGGERSLDTLQLTSSQSLGNNGLSLLYTDRQGQFQVNLNYFLLGGSTGSGSADLAEQIRIQNLTGSELDFHFFQYSDFDLGGTVLDAGARLKDDNAIDQWDLHSVLSETVITPPPDHWQIDTFPNVLLALNDQSPTTLTDATSPMGQGDLTWAFEWDKELGAHGSFLISKDKQIRVPDGSSSLLLLGLALTGIRLLKSRLQRS